MYTPKTWTRKATYGVSVRETCRALPPRSAALGRRRAGRRPRCPPLAPPLNTNAAPFSPSRAGSNARGDPPMASL
jgi:hypothetical protein